MTDPRALDEVMALVGQKVRRLSDLRAVREATIVRRDRLVEARADVQTEMAELDQTRIVLRSIEQAQSAQLKDRAEALVTHALQTIFDRPLRFEVEFETRGLQTEARFRIRDEHGTIASVKDAHGGGLLVVASFVLRVIVLLSIRPALRPVLSMDEPFVQVAARHRPKLVSFLKQLAEQTGIQFLFVTHMDELVEAADKVYRVALRDGLSVVTEESVEVRV